MRNGISKKWGTHFLSFGWRLFKQTQATKWFSNPSLICKVNLKMTILAEGSFVIHNFKQNNFYLDSVWNVNIIPIVHLHCSVILVFWLSLWNTKEKSLSSSNMVSWGVKMAFYFSAPARMVKCTKISTNMVCTLESGIVVPVRLLIFENFSHQYFLIPASTFINFYHKMD